MGSHSLLQGSNPSLLYCRQILYFLRYHFDHQKLLEVIVIDEFSRVVGYKINMQKLVSNFLYANKL